METAVASQTVAAASRHAMFDAKPLPWRTGPEIQGLDRRRSDAVWAARCADRTAAELNRFFARLKN